MARQPPWQADLGLATGAWAFKPEPDGTEVPDAGIDTGIQRLRPGERLGPNFTGRTVASAKTAQALEFHGAPESRPVVFRDPESGRLMYGAASRLVKGSMLQETVTLSRLTGCSTALVGASDWGWSPAPPATRRNPSWWHRPGWCTRWAVWF